MKDTRLENNTDRVSTRNIFGVFWRFGRHPFSMSVWLSGRAEADNATVQRVCDMDLLSSE